MKQSLLALLSFPLLQPQGMAEELLLGHWGVTALWTSSGTSALWDQELLGNLLLF